MPMPPTPRCRRSAPSLAAAAFAIAAAVWLHQAPAPLAAQGGADRSALAELLQLRGRLVHVSYSPGSLDRAVRVQQRFERLADDFGGWSKRRAPLLVHVFDRDDWERAGLGLPYGFPARMPLYSVALPARGDEETVAFWRDQLGGALPALEPRPMHGTPEEAASVAVADLFGQVEAARVLIGRAGLLGSEIWITELMAHALVAASRTRHEPGLAAAADELAGRLAARGDGALALTGYRAGVSLDDWLRFQSRFHQGARALLGSRPEAAAKRLMRLAAKRDEPLDAATLDKRYPAVADWRRTAFTP